jgi:hypothetical protein
MMLYQLQNIRVYYVKLIGMIIFECRHYRKGKRKTLPQQDVSPKALSLDCLSCLDSLGMSRQSERAQSDDRTNLTAHTAKCRTTFRVRICGPCRCWDLLPAVDNRIADFIVTNAVTPYNLFRCKTKPNNWMQIFNFFNLCLTVAMFKVVRHAPLQPPHCFFTPASLWWSSFSL